MFALENKSHVRNRVSAPDKLEYIKEASSADFFIRLFFICTEDASINTRRIQRRHGEGGHSVPPDKIISRYAKSIAQCAAAVKLVDRAYIYDNSIDDADPALLFRTENGVLKKLYRQPVNDWAKPILNQTS